MPPFRNLAIFLTANVTGLTAGVATASKELRSLSTSAAQASASGSKSLNELSAAQRQGLRTMSTWAAAAGVVVVGAMALMVKGAVDLDRNMRNVQTIMQDDRGQRLSEKGFRDVTAAVVDMSTTVPQSASNLAKGLYDVVSSGFQGSQALMILRTSAIAASAGLTDTATAARGIVSVLNAYGLSAGSATHVSDVLFQTVNLGVITFEQLANVIGNFIGTAHIAGVSIEEANAAIAAMTLSGLDASEAGTSLNRVIQSLIKPSAAMQNALKSMGFETGQAAIKSIGLRGILKQLHASIGDNAAAWVELFPELRAVRGALALSANEGKNLDRVYAGLTDTTQVANAAQHAFEVQSQGVGFQMNIAKNQVMAAAIGIGTSLLPVLRVGAQVIGILAAGFSSIPAPIRTMATFLAIALAGTLLLTAGLMRLNLALTQMQARLAATGAAGGAFATAIGVATRALGFIGLALTAYALIQGRGAQKAEEHKQRVERLTEALLQNADAADKAAKAETIKNLVDDGAIKNARALGVSIDDVVGAAMGDKGALARVAETLTVLWSKLATEPGALPSNARQKMEDLAGAVGVGATAMRDATSAANDRRAAESAVGIQTDQSTGAIDQQIGALGGLEGAAGGAGGATWFLTEAQQGLQKTLQGATGIASAFDEIVASHESATNAAEKHDKAQKKQQRSASELEAALIGVERATMRVSEATTALASAQEDQATHVVVLRLERDLADAYEQETRAAWALFDANRALEDARRRQSEGRDVAQAQFGVARAQEAQAQTAADVAQAQEKLALAQDHGTPEELAQSERELSEVLRRQQENVWGTEDASVALKRAQDDLASNRDVVQAQLDLDAAARAQAGSVDAVRTAERALADARAADTTLLTVRQAQLDLRDAVNGVASAQETMRGGQDPVSESLDTFTKKTNAAKVGVQELIDVMQQHITKALAFSDNLTFIAQHGGPQWMVEKLQGMGDKGIEIAGQLKTMPDKIKPMYDVMVADAILGTGQWSAWVTAKTTEGKTSAEFWTGQMVQAMANQLGVAPDKAKEILDRYLHVIAGELQPLALPWSDAATNWSSPMHGWAVFAGNVNHATGGVDAHVTTSPTVLYGERQTGGEAFIPRRGISRGRGLGILSTAASWYGASVTPMQAGGIMSPPYNEFYGVQRHGGLPAMRAAELANLYGILTARALQGQMAEAAGARSGQTGAGAMPTGTGPYHDLVTVGRAMQSMGYRVGEHPAFGGVAPVHVRGSYHYQGRAIDVNWPDAGGEPARLDSLSGWIRSNVSPITELLWRVAGHFDHLHLAMSRGGILAQVMDNGGVLAPGYNLAYNGTGAPERLTRRGAGGLTIRNDVRVDIRGLAVLDEAGLHDRISDTVERAVNVNTAEILREVAAR